MKPDLCKEEHHVFLFKASAHSFKRFTSRPLKLSFTLSMHLLPRTNDLILFERCQSSCEEHGTSEHYKKKYCPR